MHRKLCWFYNRCRGSLPRACRVRAAVGVLGDMPGGFPRIRYFEGVALRKDERWFRAVWRKHLQRHDLNEASRCNDALTLSRNSAQTQL